MDLQQWEKVNRIVDTALKLNGKERSTYIKKQCRGNKHLLQEVTALLQSIEQSERTDFLEGTGAYPKNLMTDFSKEGEREPTSSMIGETIDRYKITDLIGHGGMGSVFMAKRGDEVYNQKVALKLMRRGMDTPSNIARFKRERRILAKLDHPNVARLLDGGVTDEGLPYLVMEYVEGKPVYEYCDCKNLSVEQRLDLFKDICRAVKHAHQNAIIHRDIKPSNILVTEDGTIKILDFGIAKLLAPENSDRTLFKTQTGARMLTFGYAAPEQVENIQVTTSTDAYMLGVIMFELLTGVHPFKMDNMDLAEIEQVIREHTPEKPSKRITDLSENDLEEIARKRGLSVSELPKALKGDLDSIIMKALRKEPEARYNSAEQLLEDLERRRKDIPIIAREDTWRYNTSKFIKRHRTGFSVAAGFLLLVIGFGILYTWQVTKERNKARIEAKKAQQVSDFLTDMFQASDPTFNPKDTVTAATFLKRGQKRINQLNDQPKVQAELLRIIGRAHTNIGNYEKAEAPLERSLAIRKKLFGNTHPKYASSLSEMAYLQQKKGNFAKAESLYKRAITIEKDSFGNNDEHTAEALAGLASALSRQGKFGVADSIYNKALDVQQRVLQPDNFKIANTLSNWALTLRHLGNFEKAKKMDLKALAIWQKNYGEVHPLILEGLNNLAIITEKMGDFAAADSFYQKALTVNHKLYKGPNPNTAQLLNNIGTTYIKAGWLDKAEPYLKKALKMRKKVLQPEHPSMAESYSNLGRLYIEADEYKEARPLIKQALEIDKAKHGKNHPYVGGDLRNLGFIEKDLDHYDKAEDYFRQSLEILRKTLPPDHPSIAVSLASLGKIYYLKGNPEAAEPLLRKSLEIKNKKFDEGDIRIAQSQVPLGAVLTELGHFKEAEKLLQAGYKTYKKERGSDNKNTQKGRKYLLKLYSTWGKPDKADQYNQHS